MATIYQIKNTAGSRTISILPQGVDGRNKSTAETDVNLPGQGATLWGDDLNESLYHIVESFACPAKVSLPGVPQDESDLGTGLGINNPVPGQLWFNTDINKMLVYGNSGAGSPAFDGFQSINSIVGGTTEPSAPLLGDLWYDETLPQLKIYDGAAFTSVAERYLLLDGTSTMAGDLDVGGNDIINVANSPAAGTHAANKNYVDQEITTLSDSLTSGSPRLLDSIYVNVTGDTMSGPLDMGSNLISSVTDPVSPQDAATKTYADTKVGKPGGATTGNLMAFDSNEDAVDSGISAAALSVPTGTVQMFAGSTVPPGYLLCDGALTNAAVFPDLFAVIGNTFGGTAGGSPPTGNFNVPDFGGRSPMGVGASSGDRSGSGSISIAQTLGDWSSRLTSVNQMPAHNHGGGSHRHFIMRKGAGAFRAFLTNLYDTFALHSNQGGTGAAEYALSASSSGTPNAGVTDFQGGVTTQGASSSFNTVTPTLGVNFIIKT